MTEDRASAEAAWESIPIRDGLELAIQRQGFSREGIHFSFETAPLEFSYFLAGSAHHEIRLPGGRRREVHVAPGERSVGQLSGCSGCSRTADKNGYSALAILVDRLTLAEMLQVSPENNDEFISHAFSSPFVRTSAMGGAVGRISREIISCEKGPFQRLYLEAKVLELLSEEFLHFDTRGNGEDPDFVERIRSAKALLTADLTAPPSLMDLARAVGLTHTRLNQGFRNLYGDTAFGVLRCERIRMARRLLCDSRLSVTEIAYETGFSSPSHFSRSFTAACGQTPLAFRKGEILQMKK